MGWSVECKNHSDTSKEQKHWRDRIFRKKVTHFTIKSVVGLGGQLMSNTLMPIKNVVRCVT